MEEGYDLLTDPYIKKLFVGEHVRYDVKTCRLVNSCYNLLWASHSNISIGI